MSTLLSVLATLNIHLYTPVESEYCVVSKPNFRSSYRSQRNVNAQRSLTLVSHHHSGFDRLVGLGGDGR